MAGMMSLVRAPRRGWPLLSIRSSAGAARSASASASAGQTLRAVVRPSGRPQASATARLSATAPVIGQGPAVGGGVATGGIAAGRNGAAGVDDAAVVDEAAACTGLADGDTSAFGVGSALIGAIGVRCTRGGREALPNVGRSDIGSPSPTRRGVGATGGGSAGVDPGIGGGATSGSRAPAVMDRPVSLGGRSGSPARSGCSPRRGAEPSASTAGVALCSPAAVGVALGCIAVGAGRCSMPVGVAPRCAGGAHRRRRPRLARLGSYGWDGAVALHRDRCRGTPIAVGRGTALNNRCGRRGGRSLAWPGRDAGPRDVRGQWSRGRRRRRQRDRRWRRSGRLDRRFGARLRFSRTPGCLDARQGRFTAHQRRPADQRRRRRTLRGAADNGGLRLFKRRRGRVHRLRARGGRLANRFRHVPLGPLHRGSRRAGRLRIGGSKADRGSRQRFPARGSRRCRRLRPPRSG